MILPTAYLAPVSWYKTFLEEPCEIEIYESFEKQTIRNRCRIAGPNGVQTLTVPVVKCESKQLTRDVRISWQEDWRHRHRQALMSAYRNTPFFDYYQDLLFPVYERKYNFLLDLNEALHEVVMRLLEKQQPLQHTTNFQGTTCQQPNNPPVKAYYQIFANKQGFQTDLSIVDLLFNMGTEAPLYL